MDGQVRVSVRSLVEFSIHGEDIFPVSSKRDMALGTKGHKARQGMLGEGWQTEVPLSLEAEAEGIMFLITGRMDAYYEADIPIIEEQKLSYSGSAAPQAVFPAHRAQAIVYGHMVCVEKGNKQFRFGWYMLQKQALNGHPSKNIAAPQNSMMNSVQYCWLWPDGKACNCSTELNGMRALSIFHFHLTPIGRASGRWRYRYSLRFEIISGCSPACPPVRANLLPCCTPH